MIDCNNKTYSCYYYLLENQLTPLATQVHSLPRYTTQVHCSWLWAKSLGASMDGSSLTLDLLRIMYIPRPSTPSILYHVVAPDPSDLCRDPCPVVLSTLLVCMSAPKIHMAWWRQVMSRWVRALCDQRSRSRAAVLPCRKIHGCGVPRDVSSPVITIRLDPHLPT